MKDAVNRPLGLVLPWKVASLEQDIASALREALKPVKEKGASP